MEMENIGFANGFKASILDSRNYKKQSETESKVMDFLASIGVRFDISSAGENLKRDNWTCDGWRVTFETVPAFHKGHPEKSRVIRSECFDYYTGTGHRFNPYPKNNFMYDPNGAKPVYPHIAGVLHSLILDSSAAEMSFYQWCGDYGYDSDSIKAFNTYQECEKGARKLAQIFTSADVEALRDILAEY